MIVFAFPVCSAPRSPTVRAADAAGAARGLGAVYACGSVPAAVPVPTPASGAPDAGRWAVVRTAKPSA